MRLLVKTMFDELRVVVYKFWTLTISGYIEKEFQRRMESLQKEIRAL